MHKGLVQLDALTQDQQEFVIRQGSAPGSLTQTDRNPRENPKIGASARARRQRRKRRGTRRGCPYGGRYI